MARDSTPAPFVRERVSRYSLLRGFDRLRMLRWGRAHAYATSPGSSIRLPRCRHDAIAALCRVAFYNSFVITDIQGQTEQQVQTLTRQEAESLKSLLPMYAVIIHNDDVNPMDFVVQALLKSVPALSHEDAIGIMIEAHNEGRAVVIVCPLEPAELYCDRIRSFTIGCNIEKA